MGEIVGAQIYLTEMVQPPARYPVTALLGVSSDLGALLALGIAFLVTSFGMNWRYAFWAGALIAVVGAFARTRLRETPEFIQMERQWMREVAKETNLAADALTGTNEGAKFNATWKEPVRPKTLISYFLYLVGCLCAFTWHSFISILFLKKILGILLQIL